MIIVYLETELKQLEASEEVKELIENNENVMICCGRNGRMCLPVFREMEQLQEEDYKNVEFRAMLFDLPGSQIIRDLPETKTFRGLPFTIYYKNGKVVEATSSIQTREEITSILNKHFK